MNWALDAEQDMIFRDINSKHQRAEITKRDASYSTLAVWQSTAQPADRLPMNPKQLSALMTTVELNDLIISYWARWDSIFVCL